MMKLIAVRIGLMRKALPFILLLLNSWGRAASATILYGDNILRDFTTPEDVPRLALVMGVQNYEYLDRVPNALNDAENTAEALVRAGFSSVRLLQNPEEQNVYDAIEELAQRTSVTYEPAVVVIFFAGHGFQSEGQIYFAPADAARNDPVDKSISIYDLMSKINTARHSGGRDQVGGLAILFGDTCRTPVSLNKERRVGGGADIPGGAVLSLATKAGAPARSAAHFGDSSSPYASALEKFMPVESLRLGVMFERVRNMVEALTQDEQSPDVIAGVNFEGFYFRPTVTQRAEEEATWLATLESNSSTCVRLYIKNHPDSRFAKAALRWLGYAEDVNLKVGGTACPEE